VSDFNNPTLTKKWSSAKNRIDSNQACSRSYAHPPRACNPAYTIKANTCQTSMYVCNYAWCNRGHSFRRIFSTLPYAMASNQAVQRKQPRNHPTRHAYTTAGQWSAIWSLCKSSDQRSCCLHAVMHQSTRPTHS
jgi:hypothetical protein